MNKTTLAIAAFGAALAGGNAFANMELAQKSGCTSCHAVDKKIVGPSYKDVAAKYKGNADAEKNLTEHLTTAGKHPAVKTKDAGEIKNLAQFILSR